MARRRIFIPEEVKLRIRNHLSTQYAKALDGYYSANEDEDTLTGDLFSSLRIKNQEVTVQDDQISGVYKWSINYTKLRGRGADATEKLIGADGIVELELDWGYKKESKSILFQAKHNWSTDTKLIEQCTLLSTWREAAFVLNYAPDKYEAFDLDFIFENRGKKPSKYASKTITDYLGAEFLNCVVGDSELMYDPRKRILRWRSINGLTVATKFSIPHRLTIDVKAPIPGKDASYGKLIGQQDIHNYRMEANDDEILSLPHNYSHNELSKAKKKLALLYHPDKYDFLSALEKAILNRRMQEINSAFDDVIAST